MFPETNVTYILQDVTFPLFNIFVHIATKLSKHTGPRREAGLEKIKEIS